MCVLWPTDVAGWGACYRGDGLRCVGIRSGCGWDQRVRSADLPLHPWMGLSSHMARLHLCSTVLGGRICTLPPGSPVQVHRSTWVEGADFFWVGRAVCPAVLTLFLEEIGQSELEQACLLPWKPGHWNHSAVTLVPPDLGAPVRNNKTEKAESRKGS